MPSLIGTIPKRECPHKKENLRFIKNLSENEQSQIDAKSMWLCNDCNSIVYRTIEFPIGEYSDGHHTFNELYDHRAALTVALAHTLPSRSWKAKKHFDGTMYEGMFIVGIDTPDGLVTYHYDLDPWWDIFDCKEIDHSPEWDGKDASATIDELKSITKLPIKDPSEVNNRVYSYKDSLSAINIGKLMIRGIKDINEAFR